ncbi:MAG: UDP-galactopyranose mutase [Tannerella sp.]|jgi:UDP-galactopyranose mutase|nr:UDP-galactopyranose mutase [Tannerella sp.]
MNKGYKYDYLLVGAGLFNAVFAHEAAQDGKRCLVIEKRLHAGGNLHCRQIEGIHVHSYGAHIFHTSNRVVWDYMNRLCEFNHYINSPLAIYKNRVYNLPFNMNTFHQLWGIVTPEEAKKIIDSQRAKIDKPHNCEEQALALVGRDIYETLIKGYTEKQWGRKVSELPAFIIRRIPLRYTYDNNYFDDPYQGIPKGGYNGIFEKCFACADVMLNTDFFKNRHLTEQAKTVIYTGMIDRYFDYCFGNLEYRSLRFETETLDTGNYQGNAVINYTGVEIPYTRILEHKHFDFGRQKKTVITKEYPVNGEAGLEPYYPVNTEANSRMLNQYRQMASRESNLFFAGRLGTYRYLNMDQIVHESLELYKLLTQ